MLLAAYALLQRTIQEHHKQDMQPSYLLEMKLKQDLWLSGLVSQQVWHSCSK